MGVGYSDLVGLGVIIVAHEYPLDGFILSLLPDCHGYEGPALAAVGP